MIKKRGMSALVKDGGGGGGGERLMGMGGGGGGGLGNARIKHLSF